jgi:hypothetical protein
VVGNHREADVVAVDAAVRAAGEVKIITIMRQEEEMKSSTEEAEEGGDEVVQGEDVDARIIATSTTAAAVQQ